MAEMYIFLRHIRQNWGCEGVKTPEITCRNPQNTGLLCIKHRMFVAETSELSIEEVRCCPVSARHFSRKSPKIPRFCPEIPILHPLVFLLPFPLSRVPTPFSAAQNLKFFDKTLPIRLPYQLNQFQSVFTFTHTLFAIIMNPDYADRNWKSAKSVQIRIQKVVLVVYVVSVVVLKTFGCCLRPPPHGNYNLRQLWQPGQLGQPCLVACGGILRMFFGLLVSRRWWLVTNLVWVCLLFPATWLLWMDKK